MHCNVYPIFVKFVRLTYSNKELLTYLLTCMGVMLACAEGWRLLLTDLNRPL